MAEQLVFDHTFDAFARALGSQLTDKVKPRFVAIGVDYDKTLLPAYPLSTWLQVMKIGAELLAPGLTAAEQYYVLGTRIVASYEETLLGRALVTMMRVIGPRRSLERMSRNLRTANNFTQTSLETLADGRMAVRCTPVISTDFFRGLFTAALEASGGREVRVELVSFEAAVGVFAVQWR